MLEKNLDKAIEKVLVSEEEIIEKSKELGEILTKEYEGKNPLVLGILRGSVPFLAELIKHIDCHLETDFMTVSSYHGGTKSSGEVKLILDVDTAVKGRDILIVEDIIDTGRTLKYLKELLEHRGANVKIFPSLLAKSSRISNSRLVKSKTFSSKVTSFFIKSMTNLSVTNDEGLSSKASLTV